MSFHLFFLLLLLLLLGGDKQCEYVNLGRARERKEERALTRTHNHNIKWAKDKWFASVSVLFTVCVVMSVGMLLSSVCVCVQSMFAIVNVWKVEILVWILISQRMWRQRTSQWVTICYCYFLYYLISFSPPSLSSHASSSFILHSHRWSCLCLSTSLSLSLAPCVCKQSRMWIIVLNKHTFYWQLAVWLSIAERDNIKQH